MLYLLTGAVSWLKVGLYSIPFVGKNTGNYLFCNPREKIFVPIGNLSSGSLSTFIGVCLNTRQKRKYHCDLFPKVNQHHNLEKVVLENEEECVLNKSYKSWETKVLRSSVFLKFLSKLRGA